MDLSTRCICVTWAFISDGLSGQCLFSAEAHPCGGRSDEWDLMVSKMASIARVNDLPVITGIDYFSIMALSKHHTHSEHAKRNMLSCDLMLEDAVNAAYAINPEGSILASAQAADALPVGTGVQPKPSTAFLRAIAEQAKQEAYGPLAGAGAPTPTASASSALSIHVDAALGLDAIVYPTEHRRHALPLPTA